MSLNTTFQEYRQIWENMEGSTHVKEARQALAEFDANTQARRAELQERLYAAEAIYRGQLTTIGGVIISEVRAIGKTIEMAGIRASYTKGRATTSWKSVAMMFMPSDRLIGKYMTIGEPKVTIEIVKGEGWTFGKKFSSSP